MVQDGVDGDAQHPGDKHAQRAGGKADDDRLRVEHGGHVPLGGANGPQNADFLGALLDGNQGDDANHNGGDHQGHGHKGDEHIGDGVDDGGDGGKHQADVVGVLDLLQIVLGFVVVGDGLLDDVLVLKGGGVQADGGRVVQIDVAQLHQVLLVGGVGEGEHLVVVLGALLGGVGVHGGQLCCVSVRYVRRSPAAAGAGSSNGKFLPVPAPAKGQGRRQVPHGTERWSGRRR